MLGIGGRTLSFGASGELNRWVWEALDSLSLPQGALTLTMSRETPPGEPYAPLAVDTLVFARDPAFDPARESEWVNADDSGEQAVGPQPPYAYRFTGDRGTYRCYVQAFAGDWLVDGQGRRGVSSDWIYFSMR
jgi:hypothetical protein